MANRGNFLEVFRDNLTRLANLKGATQKEIADFMGVSAATVSCWMSGNKVPRMKKLDQLCDYFNISREELLGIPAPADVRLTSQEEKLVMNFRKLNSGNQQLIDRVMTALLVQQAAETFEDVVHSSRNPRD